MEPADHHRQGGGAELAAEIERARKLVGLHPDQPDEARAGGAQAPDRALDADDRVALVVHLDLDVDLGPERLPLRAFGQQAVDAGEAVGRDGGAMPLDDIAVGVVVRRLDQDDEESPRRCGRPRRPTPSRARHRNRQFPAKGFQKVQFHPRVLAQPHFRAFARRFAA
jgi:hypothetical protein